MDKQQYIQFRKTTLIDEISHGYRTVSLFAEGELDEEQLGYRINALTGELSFDWQESWLVIGQEDLAGEPLFIDLQNDELPHLGLRIDRFQSPPGSPSNRPRRR